MAPDHQLQAEALGGLPPCKLCGARTAAFDERNSFAIARCPDCGFMFAVLPESYRPEILYSEDSYFTAEDPEAERVLQQSSTTLSTLYPPRLARIREFTRIREFIGPGRMLDIGCAGGSFLAAAEAAGWTVWGVELSGVMRERASRQLGRPVFSSIEEALEGSERFECVTMFEVIEHLQSPLETMRKVARLLAPNGVLAMSTPNCECPEARGAFPFNVWLIPPEHIAYFGPQTLPLCLKLAGLEVLALEGLEGFWRAITGDTMLPRWISAWLRPLRHGKRLRPGGWSGRWLKRRYSPDSRIDLYQRRRPIDLTALDTLEIYARRLA